MATASPEKRRVLGILDANRPSPTFRKQLLPGGKLAPVSVASERLRAVVEQPQLPLKRATVPDLRSEGDGTMLPPTKKQRSSEPVADGLDGHEVEPQVCCGPPSRRDAVG